MRSASQAATQCWGVSTGGTQEDSDKVDAGRYSLVRVRDDGGLHQGEARKKDPLAWRLEGSQETTTHAGPSACSLAYGEQGAWLSCCDHVARVLRPGWRGAEIFLQTLWEGSCGN